MDLLIAGGFLLFVILLYFRNNPLRHGSWFMVRRFVNWFPLGMSYAFLYMGRYNLNVSKNALGSAINNIEFGWIFGVGTFVYALSLFMNGPIVDKMGGKRGIMIASLGAAMANGAMGLATYLYLHDRMPVSFVWTLGVLYAINMFFQSYGAVSIIKVKAYWFHVRERGLFGAIFGTLISFGVYFAFDWGQAIVNASKAKITGEPTQLQRLFQILFATDTNSVDAIWLVFFIPSAIMIFWAMMDLFLIKDTPEEAGFPVFEVHDASHGAMHVEHSKLELIKKMLSNPIILTVAFIELTSGVLRNGIMQWYPTMAKQMPQVGAEFFSQRWGIIMAATGIIGGFAGGMISDKIFHSRRGPPAAIFNFLMFCAAVSMALFFLSSPVTLGFSAITITCLVIGVHSLMSGTAAADFGGRKATATASGLADGFVYIGTAIQSVSLGYITTYDWQLWPVFLAPFALMGMILALRIWRDLPEATKHYIRSVEKITIVTEKTTIITRREAEPVQIN